MKIKFILIATSLFSISFAQNSTGLTFAEYLRQIQNADSLPKIDTLKNTDSSEAKPVVPVAPAPAAPIVQEPVAAAPEAPPPAPLVTYEIFLDNIEAYANSVLPEKEKLELQKAAIKADITEPKDEFEKQVDYEKRLADFEKAKEQKILALEKEYQEKVKETAGKIKTDISSKEDFQPNWEGMLKKNADIEEYRERINIFTDRIPKMEERITQITKLLSRLDFSKAETEALSKRWNEKNRIYIARLEKARELMQDYILQEQAKVLSTDRQKFEMSLGAYHADNEEFIFNMNDTASQTVPFDFTGTIKISPQQARETNRQTTDFTASVDYINYPFTTDKAKLYPGVKKTHVFYREQELPTNGSFKGVPGLGNMPGYAEWAFYADSLLTGKLAPRNLDSLYVMGTSGLKIATGIDKSKESSGGSFFTSTAFRVTMLGLSAASVGLGIWQNGEADSKNKQMKKDISDAKNLDTESTEYADKYKAAQKSQDEAKKSETLRNGLYIGAGVFGLVGVVSFFF